MHAEGKKALIFDLADTVLQSWWTVVAGVCLGLVGALVALDQVQEYYVASATIYVTPEISREIGRPLVADDMTRRMAALQEGVLSDEYVRQMIARIYGLPESEEDVKKMMRGVRSRVDIDPTALGPTAGPEALYGFELSYVDTKPERAAAAANMLAQLYIDQNSELRSRQAREAATAAQDQAARAKAGFDEIDRKLIAYRERHRFETEDQQDANLRLMERRQGELESNLTSQRAGDIQIQELEKRLVDAEEGAESTVAEISRLRRELDELLSSYSEAHPDVIRVRRQLEEALAAMGVDEEARERDAIAYPPSPQVSALKVQIAAARREQGALQERERVIRREIAEYERRIAAVPNVQPQLSRLETEHTMLRRRYEALQTKADEGAQALFVEERLQGERFELAELAEAPSEPFSPEPRRFFALGVLAGCLLFVGPLLARRVLNPLISSEAALRVLSDVQLLVTIPRILTPATQGLAARRWIKNLALSTLCTATAVTAFVFLG